MNNWKKFKDELPPIKEKILVCHEGKINLATFHYTLCIENGYQVWDGGSGDIRNSDDLWMLLPEVPEVKE